MAHDTALDRRDFLRIIGSVGAFTLMSQFTSACSPASERKPVNSTSVATASGDAVQLPEPAKKGNVSVEEVLARRRSIRAYSGKALTLQEVSQLLWAGQGITADWGGRVAPSAGALYPLELYVAIGSVDDLSLGVYRYSPKLHQLDLMKHGDVREQLAAAALGQSWMKDGAICIIIAAVCERTTGKYGDRGIRYVYIEAGHAAQNICLQATALNLGTVTVGAFVDDSVTEVVGLSRDEVPLYLLPVGRT